jgi:hypothetical protein
MRARVLLVLVAALFVSACASREGACAPHNFSAAEAARLAGTYMLFHISGCGWTGPPVARSDHWEVPVFVGIAGKPSGAIHVDRHAGTLSYTWHGKSGPTLTPKQLWNEKYMKTHPWQV